MTDTIETEPDADGCLDLAEGDLVTATVTGAGRLTVRLRADQALLLTWDDEFGTGTRRAPAAEAERVAIGLASPEGFATLTLSSESDNLRVCGFTK